MKLKNGNTQKIFFLTNEGKEREAPNEGEIFVQMDLYNTLKKLVKTEREALSNGKNRKEAIYEAYRRFYEGDIADEIANDIPGVLSITISRATIFSASFKVPRCTNIDNF